MINIPHPLKNVYSSKFTGIKRLDKFQYIGTRHDEDADDEDYIKNHIVKSLAIHGNAFSQESVTFGFVKDAILESNILLISFIRGNPRGFVAIKKLVDNTKRQYLYIDLLCNSKRPGVKTRGSIGLPIISGKDLLYQVSKIANEYGCHYIKLSALQDVITYYYKYGYKLIKQENKPFMDKYMSDLYIAKKKDDQEKVDEILRRRVFKNALHGIYTIPDIRLTYDPDLDIYDEAIDFGFTMILHLKS